MKAILPIFCRPLGYVIILIVLFTPFVLHLSGIINDNNLLFYKECSKLLIMLGALMILLALHKEESLATEQIRIKTIRQAVFITILFVFNLSSG